MQYALYVIHKGEYKMAARLYELGGVHICLHEERKQSQEHFKTGSFGGIDFDVLAQLAAWRPAIGRVKVIHRLGKDGPAFELWADEIPTLGTLQHWDERHRYFAPKECWRPIVFTDDTYCPIQHNIQPQWQGGPVKTWPPARAKWVNLPEIRPPDSIKEPRRTKTAGRAKKRPDSSPAAQTSPQLSLF